MNIDNIINDLALFIQNEEATPTTIAQNRDDHFNKIMLFFLDYCYFNSIDVNQLFQEFSHVFTRYDWNTTIERYGWIIPAGLYYLILHVASEESLLYNSDSSASQFDD